MCCNNWGFWKGVIATFLDAANCYLRAKVSFDTFLRRTKSDRDAEASRSICTRLGSHHGVLETISDYVGYMKSKS